MRVLGSAKIFTNLPITPEEDERGDLIDHGANTLTAVIVSMLRQLGYKIAGPVNRQDNGWDFEVKIGEARAWVQIAYFDEREGAYLDSTFHPMFNLFAKAPYAPYGEMLTRLNDEMAKDSRFQSVKWYRESSRQGEGFDAPVIG